MEKTFGKKWEHGGGTIDERVGSSDTARQLELTLTYTSNGWCTCGVDTGAGDDSITRVSTRTSGSDNKWMPMRTGFHIAHCCSGLKFCTGVEPGRGLEFWLFVLIDTETSAGGEFTPVSSKNLGHRALFVLNNVPELWVLCGEVNTFAAGDHLSNSYFTCSLWDARRRGANTIGCGGGDGGGVVADLGLASFLNWFTISVLETSMDVDLVVVTLDASGGGANGFTTVDVGTRVDVAW